MSALITWPVIPMLFDVADRYQLWETELFAPYVAAKEFAGSVSNAMALAQALHPSVACTLSAHNGELGQAEERAGHSVAGSFFA